MTREDIIRMAREAEILEWCEGETDAFIEELTDCLERFAALVAAAEREACAKVLDEMAAKDKLTNYYKVAALRIRERGAP